MLLLLTTTSAAVVGFFATLLGVAPGATESWALPTAYAVAAAGVCWALVLRGVRPEVYAVIGLGANAATGRTSSLPPPGPAGPPAATGVDSPQTVG